MACEVVTECGAALVATAGIRTLVGLGSDAGVFFTADGRCTATIQMPTIKPKIAAIIMALRSVALRGGFGFTMRASDYYLLKSPAKKSFRRVE